MKLNEWVKAARKHKGWTLERLGEAMSRSKATVGFWEKGTTAPSYEQVMQIAAETGFPVPVKDVRLTAYGPSDIEDVFFDLAAMLSALPPLERAGIGSLITQVVADPECVEAAAAMAVRIANRPTETPKEVPSKSS